MQCFQGGLFFSVHCFEREGLSALLRLTFPTTDVVSLGWGECAQGKGEMGQLQGVASAFSRPSVKRQNSVAGKLLGPKIIATD